MKKGEKLAKKVTEKTDSNKSEIEKKLGAAGGYKKHIFEGEFKNNTATGYHSEVSSGSATLATYGKTSVVTTHAVGDVYQQSVHEPKTKTKKKYQSRFFPAAASENDVLIAVASYLAGIKTVPSGLGYALEGLQMTGIGGETVFPALGKDVDAE